MATTETTLNDALLLALAQIEQMKGSFNDADGEIARAIEIGCRALERPSIEISLGSFTEDGTQIDTAPPRKVQFSAEALSDILDGANQLVKAREFYDKTINDEAAGMAEYACFEEFLSALNIYNVLNDDEAPATAIQP